MAHVDSGWHASCKSAEAGLDTCNACRDAEWLMLNLMQTPMCKLHPPHVQAAPIP